MKCRYGIQFAKNKMYRPDAENLFIAFTKRKHFEPKHIPHYYLWDTEFNRIDTPEKYSTHLDDVVKSGIKIVCQTDFSCWFHYEAQRQENIVKNWEYFRIAHEKGLEVYINFNTIWLDRFDFYDKYFKMINYSCETVIYDYNHREKDYIQFELKTFAKLINKVRFKNLVCFTGKRDHRAYMPMFNRLRERGIHIIILPTEMRLLQFLSRTVYQKDRV